MGGQGLRKPNVTHTAVDTCSQVFRRALVWRSVPVCPGRSRSLVLWRWLATCLSRTPFRRAYAQRRSPALHAWLSTVQPIKWSLRHGSFPRELVPLLAFFLVVGRLVGLYGSLASAPPNSGRNMAKAIETAGGLCRFESFPKVGHSVSDEMLAMIAHWLVQRLAQTPAAAQAANP